MNYYCLVNFLYFHENIEILQERGPPELLGECRSILIIFKSFNSDKKRSKKLMKKVVSLKKGKAESMS